MKAFLLNDVELLDGFIKDKTEINETVTIFSVYERFKETGRFEALKCLKKDHADIFWDSDIAKWLEACAYILAKKDDKKLRAYYDDAISDIIRNQREDGYFNSHFQVYEPENILKRRTDHELYCAGHLFEAAVAAYEYIKDDRLLNFSEKYCKYLKRRFIEDKDTGFITPGHEEIELALYKLYKLTGNILYRELGKFFLFNRGVQQESEYDFAKHEYSQSHLPVVKQRTAEGHAVRALYLYTAMADWAKEGNNSELKQACIDIFTDITEKKMYVTGGVGSSACMEAFTIPYDLPSNTAYSETCAGIALMLFCDRLIKIDGRAVYGDILERALYNVVFAGVSHDGKSFFYVNPLSMDIERTTYQEGNKWRETLPLAERKQVFECSCCPPNINRIIEELPGYIYYSDGDTLAIYQYISSVFNNGGVEIKMHSGFPYDGKVTIDVTNAGKFSRLKVRKPLWCKRVDCNVDYIEKDGFLVFSLCDKKIELDFNMELREVYCNPLVSENVRKKALCYGPLVMCAEGADNDFNFVSAKPSVKNYCIDKGEYFKIVVDATVTEGSDALYSFERPTEKRVKLTLIPYFEWANRGRNSMRVWFIG